MPRFVAVPGSTTLSVGASVKGARRLPKLRPSRRYRSFAVLGRGGMGEVQVAHDSRIGRTVALKVLLDEAADRSDAADRFVREARIQGRLEHPSVVPVYDLGVDEHDRPYFAMKKISGVTLHDVVSDLRSGLGDVAARYTLRKRLAIFQSICLALDYAHARGVVHRDVKPGNLMLGDFGEVYVLDWGIAKVRGTIESDLGTSGRKRRVELGATDDGEVLGSLGYMAPEQIAAASEVDSRADVYSLGAVLFELFALEPLHVRGSEIELARSTREGVDARPSTRPRGREIPPELDAICVRATQIARDDRYRTARELHDAVEAYLDGVRDDALRAELAANHIALARAAFDEMLLPGSEEARLRKRALREAGRALALDPASDEATALVARMMLMPPREVPPEARAASAEARSTEQRNAIRMTALALAAIIPLAVLLPLVARVTDWRMYGMMVVSLVTSTVHAFALVRSPHLERVRHSVVVTLEFLPFIIGLSFVIAPFLLAPIVSLGAAVLVAISHWLGRARAPIIVLFCLSWIVPALLEWAGVVPEAHRFHGGEVTLVPLIVRLPEYAFRIGLIALNILAVGVISAVLWRYSQLVEQNRERQDLHTWHLENLAARQTSAGSSVPPGPMTPRKNPGAPE